ncbi:MAG: site-specific DNA-methyltransferase [Deltaproteobacteria bacterium]|nr:site-specific DNA-methyltransferase [Deltaproteobacteria bacterium]
MELNKIYNTDWLNNELPDKSVQLIIADPPYFETKGDFDFIWETFEDYLIDVEKWAIECKRLLAENGTLYWFGGSKKIAYTQVIFDKYFGLVNNLTWEKAEADGLFGSTGSEQLRSYPNSTERILMYSNDVYNLTQCVYSIRDYIRAEIKRAKGKIILKEVNKALGTATNGGGVASACLSLDKAEPAMFTKEMYQKLQVWLNDSKEYEYLRKEYEELRRPFENVTKSTEILKVRFKPSEYDHPTVKPEMLARLLILTSSRKNDLVLVPFAGSGTECAMSVKEGRNTIGFEITPKHAEMSNKRLKNILRQPSLFAGT